jgi:hypothetical protein
MDLGERENPFRVLPTSDILVLALRVLNDARTKLVDFSVSC